MKRSISPAAILVFFIVLCVCRPAGAFGERGRIYLAQQPEQSAAKQLATPGEDVSEEAEDEDEDDSQCFCPKPRKIDCRVGLYEVIPDKAH